MKRLCSATAVAIACCAIPASASADDNVCGMIVHEAFHSILQGTTVSFVRNVTAVPSARNTSGVLHSVCNGYIWSGPKPESQEAALAALRAGTASAFAIDTWEPDDQSKYVDKWVGKGFSQLVKGGPATFPALPGIGKYNARTFKPKNFGQLGSKGYRANPVPGVSAGAALWWKASEAEAAFVSIGVGGRHRLVPEINQLGGLLTADFGMLG